jgi:hypothetical protein
MTVADSVVEGIDCGGGECCSLSLATEENTFTDLYLGIAKSLTRAGVIDTGGLGVTLGRGSGVEFVATDGDGFVASEPKFLIMSRIAWLLAAEKESLLG